MDKGRGAGVSVGVDWPAQAAKFEGKAVAFDFNQSVETEPDAGRGDGQIPPPLPLSTGGGLVVTVEIRRDAWPSPPQFRGEVLSIKLMNDLRASGDALPSAFATVSVIVVGQAIGYDEEKKQTVWREKLTCRILSEPVWSGFGYGADGTQRDQPTNADQSYPNKELWAGMQKTFDPNHLIAGAQQRIRLFGIADNDVAEVNALVAIIGAALAPMAEMKLRPCSIVRRSAKVCVVDTVWGLTNTKDDALFPHEIDITKVDGLGNSSTRANLNNRPSAPNNQNTFYAGTQTLRLTDGQVKFVDTFDRWGGEKNQREKSGTYIDRDVSGLNDKGAIDLVVLTANGLPADPTPPTGLQVVNRTLRDFDNRHSDAIFSCAIDTPQQTLEQDASSQNDDPNFIDSSRATALLDAVAMRATGYRSVGIETKAIRHNRFEYTHRMSKLDSLDRLKLPRTRTKIDRNGATATNLDDEDVEVKEWLTTDTPPTAPDFVPSNNTKLLYYIDEPVYPAIDGVAGLNVRVFFYGAQSSRDRLVLGESVTNTDASGIQSTAVRAYLDGESVPSTPSGMVLRTTRTRDLSVGLSTNRTLTVLIYGLVTVQTEMENEGTVYNADPIDVYKSRTTTIVTKTSDIATMAAALQVANPDATISVKPLASTSTLVAQIIEKSGEDKKIITGAPVIRPYPMRGVPVGAVVAGQVLNSFPAASFNNTAAYVKVQVYGRAASGLGGRIFVPIEMDRALGGFIWRRAIITTTPWLSYYTDLKKKVNNATFLGNPPYTVRYCGAKTLFTTAIAYAHLAILDYVFETDDLMFCNDSAIVIGEGGSNSSPTVPVTEFVSATTFDATSLLRWPASDDFSVFLA